MADEQKRSVKQYDDIICAFSFFHNLSFITIVKIQLEKMHRPPTTQLRHPRPCALAFESCLCASCRPGNFRLAQTALTVSAQLHREWHPSSSPELAAAGTAARFVYALDRQRQRGFAETLAETPPTHQLLDNLVLPLRAQPILVSLGARSRWRQWW